MGVKETDRQGVTHGGTEKTEKVRDEGNRKIKRKEVKNHEEYV